MHVPQALIAFLAGAALVAAGPIAAPVAEVRRLILTRPCQPAAASLGRGD